MVTVLGLFVAHARSLATLSSANVEVLPRRKSGSQFSKLEMGKFTAEKRVK
jgi:hypothetical protein